MADQRGFDFNKGSGTNKTSSAFTPEQKAFLNKQTIPNQIPLGYARKYDDDVINSTNRDKWNASYGGSRYYLSFNKTDIYANKLCKWVMSHLLRTYNLGTCVMVLAVYYDELFGKPLNNKECYLALERLADQEDNHVYYALKQFVRDLIDYDFPSVDEEFLDLVEYILPPTPTNMDIYYELDVRLKTFDLNLIRRGILKTIYNLKDITTTDLIDVCSVALCYETGARPIQLFNLSDSSFYYQDGGLKNYPALEIGFAKLPRNSKDKSKTYTIRLSNETGILIAELQSRRIHNDACDQLLRDAKGSISQKLSLTKTINDVMLGFASVATQKLVKDGKLTIDPITPYDFRHNVGHSMAMAGASADEIALVMGHKSLVVARHYIAATPELVYLKQQALGENDVWLGMMGLILTGVVTEESVWSGHKVAGQVNHNLHFALGGCNCQECPFTPVRSCYGCDDFQPFVDGHHLHVREDLKIELEHLIKLSEATGQLHRNPLVMEHEETLFEVECVMRRCKLAQKGANNES